MERNHVSVLLRESEEFPDEFHLVPDCGGSSQGNMEESFHVVISPQSSEVRIDVEETEVSIRVEAPPPDRYERFFRSKWSFVTFLLTWFARIAAWIGWSSAVDFMRHQWLDYQMGELWPVKQLRRLWRWLKMVWPIRSIRTFVRKVHFGLIKPPWPLSLLRK